MRHASAVMNLNARFRKIARLRSCEIAREITKEGEKTRMFDENGEPVNVKCYRKEIRYFKGIEVVEPCRVTYWREITNEVTKEERTES